MHLQFRCKNANSHKAISFLTLLSAGPVSARDGQNWTKLIVETVVAELKR